MKTDNQLSQEVDQEFARVADKINTDNTILGKLSRFVGEGGSSVAVLATCTIVSALALGYWGSNLPTEKGAYDSYIERVVEEPRKDLERLVEKGVLVMDTEGIDTTINDFLERKKDEHIKNARGNFIGNKWGAGIGLGIVGGLLGFGGAVGGYLALDYSNKKLIPRRKIWLGNAKAKSLAKKIKLRDTMIQKEEEKQKLKVQVEDEWPAIQAKLEKKARERIIQKGKKGHSRREK